MLDKTYQPQNIEDAVYGAWEEANAFAAGAPGRERAKPFAIVIPPPNVTGSLHMGHALNNTLQDVLVRFERMRGRDVLWQPGTDHAGIATQMVVERQLMERQEPNRRDMGREEFVKRVWAVEGGVRRHHRRPAQAARLLLRLVAAALHHGRGPVARRAQGVRRSLSRRADLQGQAPRQLGPGAPDRHLRPRSRADRDQGPSLALRYPIEGRKFDPADPSTSSSSPPRGPRPCSATPPSPCIPTTSATSISSARTSILPLVGRRIPIIADEYSDPEKGTGAVKITPAHDFNDFEVGQRHGLPMVNVLSPEGKLLLDPNPEFTQGIEPGPQLKATILEFNGVFASPRAS